MTRMIFSAPQGKQVEEMSPKLKRKRNRAKRYILPREC